MRGMAMRAEKVYLVEFNTYTNCMFDTVSNKAGEWDPPIGSESYLSIPLGGLLVKESDLPAYAEYGQGFKTIKLVGSMYFAEEDR